MSTGSIGLLVLALLVVVGVATLPFRDVTRRRLERFALRQALPITADNGLLVIKYLATTRRWRGTGLLMAVLGSAAYEAVRSGRHTVHITGVEVFAGWFVGAVIAEWRVASVPVGMRRAARLERRRAGDYVPRAAVVATVGVWTVLLLAELLAAAGVSHQGSTAGETRWIELAVTIVAGTLIGMAVRRVLLRPQPLAAPDVLAADDALRSRSLYVLVGSALAVGGYLGALVAAASGSAGSGQSVRQMFELVGAAALPIFGVVLALSPRRKGARSYPVPVGS